MRWLTFNSSLPREWWLPKSLISTWQGHLNIMHSLVPNYEYWQSWKQSTHNQNNGGRGVRMVVYHYHLLLCCYSLPCPVKVCWFQNYYWLVVLKGQRKEFLHKIKTENVMLTVLLSRFGFHICCNFFYFHSFTDAFFKTFFSLFCKMFCGVLHWLCLILWTVFYFFSCAHKWLLTDCTNCTDSACCFL